MRSCGSTTPSIRTRTGARPGVGILQPLIKPKGIDDVPIVTLTLWSRDQALGGHELGQVARAIESEIKRVPDTRNVYSVGDTTPMIRVELDPGAARRRRADGDRPCRGAAGGQPRAPGRMAWSAAAASSRFRPGTFLASRDDVGGLIVSARDGKPIYLDDVATVTDAPRTPSQYAWFGTGPADAKRAHRARGIRRPP